MMNPQPLFGGAMECHVPKDWHDVSDIRQVPDHQECWQGPNGQVLIVEILNRETSVSDEQAAKYFFLDLAEANGADRASLPFTTLPHMPNIASDLPADSKLCGGMGRQFIAQGRDTDIAGNPRQLTWKWVRIDLCVIRLPQVSSEILLTLSSPQDGAIESSTHMLDELFVRILQSFRIVDWTLFGG